MMAEIIPPSDFRGRGTMRSMVEGRERSLRFSRLTGASRRASTALRAVPLPCKSRGGA